jgi:hypothetical protein
MIRESLIRMSENEARSRAYSQYLKMIFALVSLALYTRGVAALDKIQYTSVPAPYTNYEKHQILSSTSVTVNGTTEPVAVHTLIRLGDMIGTKKFGQLYSASGATIKALRACAVGETGSVTIGTKNWCSDNTDANPVTLGQNGEVNCT